MSKTKFKNAETIVKDTFLNSIYGGLEGTTEGSTLAADDPRLEDIFTMDYQKMDTQER